MHSLVVFIWETALTTITVINAAASAPSRLHWNYQQLLGMATRKSRDTILWLFFFFVKMELLGERREGWCYGWVMHVEKPKIKCIGLDEVSSSSSSSWKYEQEVSLTKWWMEFSGLQWKWDWCTLLYGALCMYICTLVYEHGLLFCGINISCIHV